MLQYDLATLGRTAGHDGASAPVRPAPRRDDAFEDESQQLLQAWTIERTRAVEVELLLARARDLLARTVAPGKAPSPATLRRARLLLAEIDRQIRPGRAG